MKSNFFPRILATVMGFLLAACSPDSPIHPHNTPDYEVKNLPLSRNWRTLNCREGTIAARYGDVTGKTLFLRYQQQQYQLQRQPSHDPAIFENGQLAFFTDGQQAVVGRPASGIVLLSDCHYK